MVTAMRIQSFPLVFLMLIGSVAAAAGEPVYLDVRTKAEWDEKHIEKSNLLDFNGANFREQISKLDKNFSYKIFCRSGNRASKAIDVMKEMGFKDVKNIGSVEDAIKITGQSCKGSKC